MSSPIQHLLVIRMGALGDCMHVLPSIDTVQDTHPSVRVDWLVLEAFHPLLTPSLEPSGGQCWPFAKPKGFLNRLYWLWQLSSQLAQAGVDGVINLHPSVLTHALSVFTLMRAGYLPWGRLAVYRKQKLSLFGHQQRSVTRLHAVDDFYRPFARLFPAMPARLSVLPRLSSQVSVSPSIHPDFAPTVGLIIGVGGKRPSRAWPVGHWQQLIQRITDADNQARVLLIGGPEEQPLVDAILGGLSESYSHLVINTVGQLSVTALAQTLAQCQVVVGGDTGPLHVAAAAACPTVIGLFAPTSVHRTGPKGEGQMIPLTPQEGLPCWPCELPECQPDAASLQCLNGQSCMSMIVPERVSQQVLAAL